MAKRDTENPNTSAANNPDIPPACLAHAEFHHWQRECWHAAAPFFTHVDPSSRMSQEAWNNYNAAAESAMAMELFADLSMADLLVDSE